MNQFRILSLPSSLFEELIGILKWYILNQSDVFKGRRRCFIHVESLQEEERDDEQIHNMHRHKSVFVTHQYTHLVFLLRN